MNNKSARKRIAQQFVVIGLGIALIYLPYVGFVFGLPWLGKALLWLTPFSFLGGFYVVGLGVAGAAAAIADLVRVKDED